jgi:hypothetical protein
MISKFWRNIQLPPSGSEICCVRIGYAIQTDCKESGHAAPQEGKRTQNLVRASREGKRGKVLFRNTISRSKKRNETAGMCFFLRVSADGSRPACPQRYVTIYRTAGEQNCFLSESLAALWLLLLSAALLWISERAFREKWIQSGQKGVLERYVCVKSKQIKKIFLDINNVVLRDTFFRNVGWFSTNYMTLYP